MWTFSICVVVFIIWRLFSCYSNYVIAFTLMIFLNSIIISITYFYYLKVFENELMLIKDNFNGYVSINGCLDELS